MADSRSRSGQVGFLQTLHALDRTLAEEIGKLIVMGIFIIGIFEVFAYVLAPFFYHMIYDKKK